MMDYKQKMIMLGRIKKTLHAGAILTFLVLGISAICTGPWRGILMMVSMVVFLVTLIRCAAMDRKLRN